MLHITFFSRTNSDVSVQPYFHPFMFIICILLRRIYASGIIRNTAATVVTSVLRIVKKYQSIKCAYPEGHSDPRNTKHAY
jgi:hypothetical protein